MKKAGCQLFTGVFFSAVWLLSGCQTPSIPIAEPTTNTEPPLAVTANWDQQRSLESTGQPLPGGYGIGDAFVNDRMRVYLKTLDAVEPRREEWEFSWVTRQWRQVVKDQPLRFNPVEFTFYDLRGKPLRVTGLGYFFRPQKEDSFEFLVDFYEVIKRGRLPNYPGAKQPTRFFGLDQSAFVLEAGGQNNLWEYNDNTPSNGFRPRAKLPLTGQTEMQTFSIGTTAGYVLIEGSIRRLYRYEPATDRWTRRADFPGRERIRGIAFSYNGRGYYGTGQGIGQTGGLRDLWEYNPTTDTWRRVTEYPGKGQTDLVAIPLEDGVYIGLGYGVSQTPIGTNAYTAQYDFWRYIP
jgi:hypothetical protein